MSGESPFPWFRAWSGESPFPWAAAPKTCTPASVRRASAVHFFGRLLITVEGDKPNPCYTISIERSPIDIFPPQYVVKACIDPGKVCAQVITPYRVSSLFISSKVERITLKTASGEMSIDVRQVAGPDTLRAAGAAEGQPPPAIRLTDSHEVEFGKPIQPREATGYSENFSFDEAFRDALNNLPASEPQHPDELTTITVTTVGALFGGFVGFNKMFVSVRAE
jgi:hypothetical protein